MRTKVTLLLLIAIIAFVPAIAQVSFASQRTTKTTSPHKALNVSFISYNPNAVTSAASAKPSASRPKSSKSKPAAAGSNRRVKTAAPVVKKTSTEEDADDYNISLKRTSFNYPKNSKADIGIAQYTAEQVLVYAKVLKQYAKKNGYDTTYAFVSNMGMFCNKKRFFVVNMVTMEIEQSGLVAHGRGQSQSMFDKQYSNEIGSKCTSLGRYKIAGRYRGAYGDSYRMVGLDSSNHNASSRNIVMHSMICIPDSDGIMPACVSDGCPAVSVKFFSSLRKIIDSRKKPVLLWIYDSNLEELVVEEEDKCKPADEVSASKYVHRCSIHCPVEKPVDY